VDLVAVDKDNKPAALKVVTANNMAKAGTLYPPDPEKAAKAREIISDIISKKLPLSSSTLTCVIMSVMRQEYHNIPGLDTLAVSLGHDGVPVLLINPDFVCSIDRPEDVIVVLAHEALHLIAQHLRIIDPSQRGDEAFTMSKEAWINNFVLTLLKRDLPTVAGKPTGVDPVKYFEWFKKTASEAGLASYPRKIEEFYSSDENVYKWMSQLPKQKRPGQNWCAHGDGEGSGIPDGMAPVLDDQQVGALAQKALEVTLRNALKESSPGAKEEIKKLMGAAEGNETAERIFGDMGAYDLLGTTSPAKRTRFWDRKVARAIASLIKPGTKLSLNRKRPEEDIFSPRGKVEEKMIVIAIDTSGSMFFGDALDKIRGMVGQTKAKSRWVWFDGEVWEFKPGEDMHGGGGTNCALVEAWILENCKRYPDAVVVVTDGIFQHFTPSKPKRWHWVITRDGDPWPREHDVPMKVTVLPF
jgi:hypothetical protein